MKIISTILLSLALLTGCSAMQMATGIASTLSGEQPSLSVDAQMGDRVANVGENDNSTINAEDNEGILTVTSNKSEKQFNGAQQITIQESNSFVEMLLYSIGLIGWLLPNPSQMYSEVKSWFSKS
ncbi:hypothetical protein CHOED_087 [Vibrio phage CHOED]|uniref:hypothetical protein n=1 Tax=Vibrio phage CHOED TaxID=1458716 RepID=UPI00042F36A1|nr:hypothetical protein CHOED_087 [Vibrio phage CHOED]AHK11947.1 hypothetical protein CHOED_087 [Vibrio phage CHOED]